MQARPVRSHVRSDTVGSVEARANTYTEVLAVGKDLVIQGKVIGGDDVDTSILLNLPVSEPQPLGLSKELFLGNLAAPVCVTPVVSGLSSSIEARGPKLDGPRRFVGRLTSFGSLLEITVNTHTRETENG